MENEIITAPAAQVVQGDLKLFTTSLRVGTLMQPGFYSVEKLDPENPDESGYQRLLNKARAKKLADYILDGQKEKDAFLPTSVFLATDKAIAHDKDTNTISFRLEDVGPFSVVDGQHRIEGLRIATELAREKSEKYPNALERILEFEVPVNIAVKLLKIHQMCHFLIVNTTQKIVDKSIEQRIYARLTQSLNVKDIPTLPGWIRKIVERGEVDKALKMVEYLNKIEDSPWFNKIQMASETKKGKPIKQKSFVKAIQKNVLTPNNPIDQYAFEKQKKIFLNYWKAIIISIEGNVEPNSVLYKTIGVDLFSKFSIPFFLKLQTRGSYTVETMQFHLKRCFENMGDEYTGIRHSDFWKSGSSAGKMNQAAINVVMNQMIVALNQSDTNGDIKI